MDDLEFRRRVYADPNTSDSDLLDAAREDETKRAFWNEQKNFDQQLKQTLDVSVPDDLAHKLIWQQSAQEFAKQKQRSRWYIGLAASIAFVFGIGLTSLYNQPLSLDNHALAHMQYAETELPHSALPVDLNQVNAKLASFGAHFTDTIGDIEVANYCHLSTVRSLHLIMNTPDGKVSVFIVPDRSDVRIADEFSDDLYHGETLQYDHANILVVGNKGTDLSQLKKEVSERIQFSI